MRRHLSPEFWTKLIQKIEQEKIPLTEVLPRMGLSRSTFYRKKQALLRGTLQEKELGRPLAFRPQVYQKEIEKILKKLYPFATYRKIWQELEPPKPSLATLYRIIKKLKVSLPSKEEKEKRVNQFIKEVSFFLKDESKTGKKEST